MNNTTIRVIYVMGAFLILLLSTYNLSIVGSQMSDENLYTNRSEGVVIIDISSGGVSDEAGLQIGDRLVMINGDSIRSSFHAQTYLDNAKPGEVLIYTIEREGQILDITVNLALLGLRIWLVALVISGILFLIFSIFIIILKPDQQAVRLVALAMMLLAFLLMNYMQFAPNIVQRPLLYKLYALLLIANGYFTVAVFSHAMLYFPERKYTKINRFWMIQAHYIIAFIMTIFAFYVVYNFNYYTAGTLTIPLLYLTGVELVNWKKRRKEFVARQKIIKIAVLIQLVVFIIFILFDQIQPLSTEYLAFTACLIPFAFFYTTLHYRVFDIYIRIKLSLIYALTQILVFSVFIIAIILIIRLLPLWNIDLPEMIITATSLEFRNTGQLDAQTQQQIQAGYLLFVGITLVLILYLSKNKLQKIIDKVFFQQKYDYRNALKQFGELLSSTFNRQDISQKSVEQIHNILKVKGTSLAFPDNGRFKFSTASGNMTALNSKMISIPDEVMNDVIQSREQLKPEQLGTIDAFIKTENLIYCGTPILSGKNRLEGILFTGEKLSESAYNHDDLELLTLFAENLGTAFERSRLYEEKAEKERLARGLEIAREIQLNSLPKCDPNYKGLQICSSLTPAMEVGGDYYDYLEIDDMHLGIIVGDVVGKGTSGAIHMSKIQGFLKTLQLENRPPEVMFERLNTLIRNNFESDFFFTALYGMFDLKSQTATIYRLGHNGLLHFDSEKKTVAVIEPGGIAFGMAETEQFGKEISSLTLNYHEGDLFIFLTDGFFEAMNESKELFGEERTCELIATHAEKNADQIMGILQGEISDFSNGHAHDDATAVVVKILPSIDDK